MDNYNSEGVIAFSTKQVSEMLQLPLSTISLYCKQNRLPCFKIGRHYRILKSDLDTFIQEAKIQL
ncbi:MAG: helix-turn-helix domain-containing protein [Acidaminococcus intestini]|uniref:Helix-turn-helix domain-containing protein n=1 Tax=Acidaminococcus intestini TaxID=187327 RepID=A0A943EDZ9_9FIRM|nr:helix-turn-helix domain-containing protein [Acidaminococcus intestini]